MNCSRPLSILNPCNTSEELNLYNSLAVVRERILVPCGKCYACLVNRQRSWVYRMAAQMEVDKWPAYFFTLTYTDDNIPKTSKGEETLVKSDLQAFMKRFRSNVDYHCDKNGLDHWSCQFYACGEYGTQTQRPHYHVLVFNCPPWIADYLHSLIKKSWKLSDLEPQLIMVTDLKLVFYITKYISKINQQKLHLRDEDKIKYYLHNSLLSGAREMAEKLMTDVYQEKPFALMSRRPAIGKSYYDKLSQNQKQFFLDSPVVHIAGLSFSLPRYYRQKIFDAYERSELLENSIQNLENQTPYQQRQNVAKNIVKERMAAYKEKRNNLF